MMAGNPNWWSMNGMHPHEIPPTHDHHHHQQQQQQQQHHQFHVFGSNSSNSNTSDSSFPPNPSPHDHQHSNHQDFPLRSWSQLLLGGLSGTSEEEEEERLDASDHVFQQEKKLAENWEDQLLLNLNPTSSFCSATRINNTSTSPIDDVKQETSYYHHHHLIHHPNIITPSINTYCWINKNDNINTPSYDHHNVATNLSNNNIILNFSGVKTLDHEAGKKINHHQQQQQHHNQDLSSECNSSGSGGVQSKKPRVQHSLAQPVLKVRKENLSREKITALHQLVSPFGKTDTASVLSETIVNIRFLHAQIQALSSPYMRNNTNASTSTIAHHHNASTTVQEMNCLFLQESNQEMADLRIRGLCLVPISSVQHVGNENGPDYWAPASFVGNF